MAYHHLGLHYQSPNNHPLAPSQPSSNGSPSQPSGSRGGSPSQLDFSSSQTSTLLHDSTSPIFLHANHNQTLIKGDINHLTSFLNDDSRFLQRVWELDGSTVLHIAAVTGQQNLISFIVSRHPALLLHHNFRGDLPVHLAVRAGHQSAVTSLVNCAISQQINVCEMLEAQNSDQNTALHVALENQQLELAEELFSCPHTFYLSNGQGISPLYLAIKAGFWKLVSKMLQHQEDHANAEKRLYSTDKSVVHAVIMAKNSGIFKIMMEDWNQLIISSLDEQNRRPLSYAAYIGFLEGVDQIISDQNLSNLAFKVDEDGSFPIHSACSGGNLRVVKKLLYHSESMKWLLNGKGQNILHVAAGSGKVEVVNYLLNERGIENLINMKDHDGHTPLHLATMYRRPKVVYTLTWDERVKLHLQDKDGFTALDLAENYEDTPSFRERLTWLALRHADVTKAPVNIRTVVLVNDPNANHSVIVNEENMPSVIQQLEAKIQKHAHKRKNKYKDRLNTLLVVSTLVATVTFASGFTVPGGYNQDEPDEGMATLAHKCAFQVFVITNTIAMYSSILAVVTLIWANLDDLGLTMLSLEFALPLLGTALAMMSVAFMSGLYVVLHTRSWLGLLVLFMGGAFLTALLVFFIPLYSPTSCIKYKVLRYVLHVPFKLMLLACHDQMDNSITLY